MLMIELDRARSSVYGIKMVVHTEQPLQYASLLWPQMFFFLLRFAIVPTLYVHFFFVFCFFALERISVLQQMA